MVVMSSSLRILISQTLIPNLWSNSNLVSLWAYANFLLTLIISKKCTWKLSIPHYNRLPPLCIATNFSSPLNRNEFRGCICRYLQNYGYFLQNSSCLPHYDLYFQFLQLKNSIKPYKVILTARSSYNYQHTLPRSKFRVGREDIMNIKGWRKFIYLSWTWYLAICWKSR